MMLLKPNRRYKNTKFWETQAYFIHDFLKTLFAVSFLEDTDFSDYQHTSHSSSTNLINGSQICLSEELGDNNNNVD